MAEAAEKQAYWTALQFNATVAEIAALTVTLLVTAAAAVAAFIAARAANKAVRVTSETAECQLRAYVTVESIETHPGNDPMSYKMEWKNSGQTPATKVVTYTNWEARIDDLPADFTYPEAAINDAAVLGPGQHLNAWTIFIPGETVRRVEQGIQRLFVWGAAEYDDIFEDTPRRKTEFCYEVVFEEEAAGFRQIGMGNRIYGPHNGMDEGCSRQPTPI